MPSHPRLTWAKLNADSLFLALLAAGSGFFDLIDPTRDAVVETVGGTYPLFWIRAGAYLVAGLLLMVALVKTSLRLETIARALLGGAIVLNVFRHVAWIGWADTRTHAAIVLLLIYGLTATLRLSVLLGKDGLRVTRPATEPEES